MKKINSWEELVERERKLAGFADEDEEDAYYDRTSERADLPDSEPLERE